MSTFISIVQALSRIYYYKDIDRCIYRNNAYLKLKLKNGKDKELYLGEFDFDSRQQFVSVIKEQKVPFDELSIWINGFYMLRKSSRNTT